MAAGAVSSRGVRAWDGAAFCVQVLPSGEAGLAEFGRWQSVPDALQRVAAAAIAEGLGSCRFFWRTTNTGPLCAVRIELRSEGRTEFALLIGDPVYSLPYELTRRELEVLTLLISGGSNTEIAATLHLSPRTVTTHVDSVMHKMGVASRTAAAIRAMDEGVLGVPVAGAATTLRPISLGRVFSAAEDSDEPELWRDRRSTSPTRRRPLILGAALPLSGSAAADGQEMVRGLEFARAEINAAGGIHGRAIEAEIIDVDISDRESVRRAIRTLAERDVDVLTSGYLAHQDVAHEEAAQTGIPYLHAATSGVMENRVAADHERFGHIFQMCPSDIHYAPTFVRFIDSLTRHRVWQPNSRRLVVLQQTSWHLIDFGIERAVQLADVAGWELEVVDMRPGVPWDETARRVLDSGPAALMIGSYFVDDHIEVVRALRTVGAQTLIYAIYAPSVPEFRERLGTDADGVIWATTTGTYSDQIGLTFARGYAQRFGNAPGRSHAGIAYDRTHIVAQAWARSDDFRDFASVAGIIRNSTYRGVNGAYAFNPVTQVAAGFTDGTGDPSLAQAHLVYQIQKGHQEIISPVPYTTSNFELPDWMHGVRTFSGIAY